jgi:DNA polymerase/3'-5' exonuclease PolX
MLRSGRWRLLERLRSRAEPERLLQMIPGVGPQLARRLYDALRVDTLDALEAAVREGRLDEVPGLGERRSSMLRKAVADLLSGARNAEVSLDPQSEESCDAAIPRPPSPR